MENLKIVCYGVRKNEVDYFNKLNTYGYTLTLVEDLLNKDNYIYAEGHNAVILRGNCLADRTNIEHFSNYGIKYLFTRTVGTNHIDFQAASDYNMKVARVPSYSPNSVAELVVTLTMMLLRHTAYTVNKTAKLDFRTDSTMFSKEIRNCTVGIIGLGKIGLTEAKLFKGLGADVIGYDVYQSEQAKKVVKFKDLDDLLSNSDIVSLHIPYIKGENENFINREFLSKMKKGSILINTSRGEIQDEAAILESLKNNHLEGFATDVIQNETSVFFKKFNNIDDMENETVKELISLYPRVLITPHIGSNTDEALKNMIETSFYNLSRHLTQGFSDNDVTLP